MKKWFLLLLLPVVLSWHSAGSADRVLSVNETMSFSVQARTLYNSPGLRLVKGHTYQFTSTLTWKDGSCKTVNANGFTSAGCDSGTPGTDLFLRANEGFRRAPGQRWFCLIGEIFSSSSNVFENLTHDQQFRIGTSRTFTPDVSGKLVCFANDAMAAYANNSGYVRVTIKRIS